MVSERRGVERRERGEESVHGRSGRVTLVRVKERPAARWADLGTEARRAARVVVVQVVVVRRRVVDMAAVWRMMLRLERIGNQLRSVEVKGESP